jgi:hypothetical protein
MCRIQAKEDIDNKVKIILIISLSYSDEYEEGLLKFIT